MRLTEIMPCLDTSPDNLQCKETEDGFSIGYHMHYTELSRMWCITVINYFSLSSLSDLNGCFL